MSKMMIRGSEYPLKKIFSDDFFFTIPHFQRPYSWTTEQSEELFQDLIRAMDNFEETDDKLPPYFLGSILLSKGDESQAEIIDGQQRLTTLTMLLAAIRSLTKSDFAEGLTTFLCEKGNIITGTPSRYRLRLRYSDAQFFQKYIQEENGIEELLELRESQLPDSQKNIRDNTIGFIRELQKLSQSQLESLTLFIVNRCFLIVVTVSAPDLDSVYRIFSVLNSRGLNLSYSDILKSEIIARVPLDQQDDYATRWEELEALLGTEQFETLFYDLRTIFSRKRLNRGVIEEFHEYVYPGHVQTSTPQKFIDTVLFPYAHALNNLLKANYQYGSSPNAKANAKEINSMFRWLNQLDHGFWIAPALYYFVQNHRQQQNLVVRFLIDLERLVVSFMICRVPPYRRIDRYCQLLEAIYKDEDLFAPASPLQLTPGERQEVCRILNGDIYHLHYVCRYVLLRLDSYRSDSGASYDYQTISIEHILPQRSHPDSKWHQTFPSKEVRERYVHRLGNLVLLSRGKNMKAENFDFDEKKQKYFFADNVSTPFVLTNEVREYREWTPAIIDQRQRRLMDALQRLWRL
ncbi:MAG: DUF262 domain-containing protein [Chloroflexota bacterium]|nr:MAG: DUF262 domain-containing protein [Chloroflexota bacterium]